MADGVFEQQEKAADSSAKAWLEEPLGRFPDLYAAPAPWGYNPSKWSQRVLISLVALPAFAAALYMGLFQLGLLRGVWDPVFGKQSEEVLLSDVSHTMTGWFRIPDSVLGALAYLGDIVFALAGSTRRWQYRPWLVMLFGLDVIPLGIVSAILVFMQGMVVNAWCFLCLFCAVISLVLVVLAYDEVWSCLLYLRRVRRLSGSGRELWRVFWGNPSAFGERAAIQLAEARGGRG